MPVPTSPWKGTTVTPPSPTECWCVVPSASTNMNCSRGLTPTPAGPNQNRQHIGGSCVDVCDNAVRWCVWRVCVRKREERAPVGVPWVGHQSSAVTCEALRRAIVEREAMSHNSNGLSLSISTKYCRKGDTRRPRMNVASAALLCTHSPNVSGVYTTTHPLTHQPGSRECAQVRAYLADFAQAARMEVEQEDLVHELALAHTSSELH